MAIFSRRTIQRIINENAKFLREGQTRNHVDRLNRMPKELTLSPEWEVILLNAFSKVGNVDHEKKFDSGKTPDIYFKTFGESHHNFVADITAISDKGLDQNNPFEAFWNDLYKIVREYGLGAKSFNLRVGSREGPTSKGGPKVELKIPGRARFSKTILGGEFKDFLHEVLASPDSPHKYAINSEDAEAMIEYNPNQKGSFGSYPSYKELFSLTNNPICDALDDKASQMKGINYPLGIILCDGGSSLIDKTPPPWFSYSTDEVIKSFLANNKEISFVVTFTIRRKKTYTNSLSKNEFIVIHNLYKGFKFDQIGFDLPGIIDKIIEAFPKPETTAFGAFNFLKSRNPNLGKSNIGGMEMGLGKGISKIKISARALLALLAGEVEQKKFFEDHGFIPSRLKPGRPFNPFNAASIRGQMIDNIILEKSESDDDDWLTFELKGPDPAISPFSVPDKG